MMIQKIIKQLMKPPEKNSRLEVGKIYQCRINRIIDPKNAVITIQGKELRANFENGITCSDRVQLKLLENNNGVTKFKVVTGNAAFEIYKDNPLLTDKHKIVNNYNLIKNLLQDKNIFPLLLITHGLDRNLLNNEREKYDNVKNLLRKKIGEKETQKFLSTIFGLYNIGDNDDKVKYDTKDFDILESFEKDDIETIINIVFNQNKMCNYFIEEISEDDKVEIIQKHESLFFRLNFSNTGEICGFLNKTDTLFITLIAENKEFISLFNKNFIKQKIYAMINKNVEIILYEKDSVISQLDDFLLDCRSDGMFSVKG